MATWASASGEVQSCVAPSRRVLPRRLLGDKCQVRMDRGNGVVTNRIDPRRGNRDAFESLSLRHLNDLSQDISANRRSRAHFPSHISLAVSSLSTHPIDAPITGSLSVSPIQGRAARLRRAVSTAAHCGIGDAEGRRPILLKRGSNEAATISPAALPSASRTEGLPDPLSGGGVHPIRDSLRERESGLLLARIDFA